MFEGSSKFNEKYKLTRLTKIFQHCLLIKITAAISLVTCLLISGCGGGGDETSNHAATCNIELNADSICAATGVAKRCSQLINDANPNWLIEDRANAGETFFDMYFGCNTIWANGPVCPSYLTKAFIQSPHPSSIVIIELGWNDAYGNFSTQAYEVQLRSTVAFLQEHGKTVVLTGLVNAPADGPFKDPAIIARGAILNSIQGKVASDTGALFADWMTVSPYISLPGDIHPNTETLNLLIQRLTSTIQPHCT